MISNMNAGKYKVRTLVFQIVMQMRHHGVPTRATGPSHPSTIEEDAMIQKARI